MRTLILGAILLLAVSASAHAALPPGISGPWYNPAQSGHGVSLEILDDGRALAFWYVFDPDGKPVHLYIEGEVVGSSIHGEAYLGRGMRFGSFDPDAHLLSRWGSVDLAFTSCDTGRLQWQPDGPAGSGYTAGSMPLTRLAVLAGLDCRLDDAGVLPVGSYTGALSAGIEPDLHGAVDRDGVLWVMQGALTPSGPYVGPDFHAIRGLPLGQLAVDATFHQNFALAGGPNGIGDRMVLQFAPGPDGLLAAAGSTDAYWTGRVEFHLRQLAPASDPLLGHFDASQLDGVTFNFRGRSQFFEHAQALRFTGDGRFCVDEVSDPCSVEGQVTGTEQGMAMLRIEASDEYSTYSGRIWVQGWSNGAPQRLVLVAVAGDGLFPGLALGLVAERE